jgi:hypothetical protein
VVVNWTEDTAGLDGHHSHSHLAAGHTLEFSAKVKRCQ